MSIDQRARVHFESMSREQVADAIHTMKVMGFGDYEIAAACRLSVEMVRTILGERREVRT